MEADEDSGRSSNQLTFEAIMACRKVGSSATTIDDVIDESGDTNVLKMIKKGVDHVNSKASIKSHKVRRFNIH